MKKLITGILLIFVLVMLVGCGDAPASAPDMPESVVEEPVVESEPVVEEPEPAVEEPEPADESTRDNPIPMGESLVTSEGIEVTVANLIKGDQAWEILEEANMFNESPASGMQYVIITVNVKNISSEREPSLVSDMDFELIGSSNKVFQSYDQSVVLPDEGDLSDLWVELYHGGEEVGSLHFYIPADEANLILVWDYSSSFFDTKQFFEVVIMEEAIVEEPEVLPSTSDAKQIEAVLREYYEAFSDYDFDRIAELFSEQSYKKELPELLVAVAFAEAFSFEFELKSIISIQVDGDSALAIVEGTAKTQGFDGESLELLQETWQLVYEDGAWKIASKTIPVEQ